MKTIIFCLLIFLFCCSFVMADGLPFEVMRINAPPASAIILYGPSSKTLKLDFSGDKLVTSGDLALDEAAKLFFEYVFNNYQVCKSEKK